MLFHAAGMAEAKFLRQDGAWHIPGPEWRPVKLALQAQGDSCYKMRYGETGSC